MSSTNRGSIRSLADEYPTPQWCVERLLEAVTLPNGQWLEPCAGSGEIIKVISRQNIKARWTAIEISPEYSKTLVEVVGQEGDVVITDFLQMPCSDIFKVDVAITNPPYSRVMDFVTKSMQLADWVIMLLRLNFLGSLKRAKFFHRHMPDVYVLPNRPSFTGEGTDSTEYAWFVWPPENFRYRGIVGVLNTTPRHIRCK